MNAIRPLNRVPPTIEQWISVREFLIPSIERLGGTHTETDIAAMVLSGVGHLWVSPNSAMVTEFRQYPRLRELSIVAAGGKKEELISMQPSLEAFAMENGCSRFRNEGRWGWRRWEGDYTGFRFLSASIVKDL